MMLIATVKAMFVTVGGRSAWFVGVPALMVWPSGDFAMSTSGSCTVQAGEPGP